MPRPGLPMRTMGRRYWLCSEIGSEGRNFQFAHHLVLFDLPLHPDLLEQRIGRLDRIGQQETVQIHVPVLEETAQARLFAWYQEGLDAFTHICPAGAMVYARQRDSLHSWLGRAPATMTEASAASPADAPLIGQTRTLAEQLNHQLHLGRDRLLELNASDFGAMGQPAQAIGDEEHTGPLAAYLDRLG